MNEDKSNFEPKDSTDIEEVKNILRLFGISGDRIRKDTKSSRAESQVRALNAAGGNYESKIVRKGLTRSKALNVEQGRVNAYSISAQNAGNTGIGLSGQSRIANAPIAPEGNLRPNPQI